MSVALSGKTMQTKFLNQALKQISFNEEYQIRAT